MAGSVLFLTLIVLLLCCIASINANTNVGVKVDVVGSRRVHNPFHALTNQLNQAEAVELDEAAELHEDADFDEEVADLDAAGAPANINVVQWGQQDSRWANDRYCFQQSTTVGRVGCTLTAVAMATAWSTGNTNAWTPKIVNNGKYITALRSLKLRQLGAAIGTPTPSMLDQGSGFIRKSTTASTRLLELIRSEIRAGKPVFIGMGLTGGNGRGIENGWTRHTVLATGVSASDDILLNDPATGRRGSLQSYMNRPQFTGFDRAASISK
jgi:hypothetical protein